MDPSIFNFAFVGFGIAVFLTIKFVSDLGCRNKSLSIWQSHKPNKKQPMRLEMPLLVQAIKNKAGKNDSLFITKDLPVNTNEIKTEFGDNDLVGFDDEIAYLLKKYCTDMRLCHGMVCRAGDEYLSLCSRVVYERALKAGTYLITKSAVNILLKNNFVNPNSMNIADLAGRGRVSIMLLTDAQKLKFGRRLFTHGSGNGLALFLASGNIIDMIVPKELTHKS